MHTYRSLRALMRLVSATLCPTTVEGAEHVPARGPVLLAGNHLSVCDSFFLMAAVPRHLTVLGKQEYFHTPGLGGRLTRELYTRLGMLPVDRGGGPAAAREVLARGGEVFAAGAPLVLYPEGTRSTDGRLYRGRPGAAGLALTHGVPLVPFGITGTDRVQPIGTTGLRPHRVRIRFGRPLPYEEFLRRERRSDGFPTTVTLRDMTLQLMRTVAELSGQEYVDAFAPAKETPSKDKQ
jgi:1-acyl-sn-glycerol-3-phosphate acyltransferase